MDQKSTCFARFLKKVEKKTKNVQNMSPWSTQGSVSGALGSIWVDFGGFGMEFWVDLGGFCMEFWYILVQKYIHTTL